MKKVEVFPVSDGIATSGQAPGESVISGEGPHESVSSKAAGESAPGESVSSKAPSESAPGESVSSKAPGESAPGESVSSKAPGKTPGESIICSKSPDGSAVSAGDSVIGRETGGAATIGYIREPTKQDVKAYRIKENDECVKENDESSQWWRSKAMMLFREMEQLPRAKWDPKDEKLLIDILERHKANVRATALAKIKENEALPYLPFSPLLDQLRVLEAPVDLELNEKEVPWDIIDASIALAQKRSESHMNVDYIIRLHPSSSAPCGFSAQLVALLHGRHLIKKPIEKTVGPWCLHPNEHIIQTYMCRG
jgi:hypothetical protein